MFPEVRELSISVAKIPQIFDNHIGRTTLEQSAACNFCQLFLERCFEALDRGRPFRASLRPDLAASLLISGELALANADSRRKFCLIPV
jgi:hypothetical protein